MSSNQISTNKESKTALKKVKRTNDVKLKSKLRSLNSEKRWIPCELSNWRRWKRTKQELCLLPNLSALKNEKRSYSTRKLPRFRANSKKKKQEPQSKKLTKYRQSRPNR